MSVNDIDTRSRRALCFTPMETDRDLIVEAVVRAERLGFEAVIVPEGWGLDSAVLITELALRTERIRLVAGIQSVWGRSAAQLAMEAATLSEVSEGRFTLGIGASTPELATGLHGTAYERPAARVADTLTTIRTLLDGGRTTKPDGRPGLRLGALPKADVPIWVAGLGPRTVELAVGRADGWFPAFIPASQLDAVRHSTGGSDRCELIVGPAAVVSTDAAFALEVVRQQIGWYLVGMGRLYGDHVADAGFASEIAILRADNPRPRPGRIVWSPQCDVLLAEFSVHGDADHVSAQLRRWDGLADLVAVTAAPGLGGGVLEVIDAAAPRAVTEVR